MEKLRIIKRIKLTIGVLMSLVVICGACAYAVGAISTSPDKSFVSDADVLDVNADEADEFDALDESGEADANADNADDLPIVEMTVQYSFDSYEEIMGYADYVFVGKVIGDPISIQKNMLSSKDTVLNIPHTIYSVEVLNNIKGDLTQTVEIQRLGGLDESGKYYRVAGDILPVEGETYIFIAKAQEDGTLIDGGMNYSIVYSEEALERVENAVQNQKVFEDVEHRTSIYDAALQ